MKRSTFITLDQLKVGLLIVFAFIVLIIAAVRLFQAANSSPGVTSGRGEPAYPRGSIS
jgi:hypothetical protein